MRKFKELFLIETFKRETVFQKIGDSFLSVLKENNFTFKDHEIRIEDFNRRFTFFISCQAMNIHITSTLEVISQNLKRYRLNTRFQITGLGKSLLIKIISRSDNSIIFSYKEMNNPEFRVARLLYDRLILELNNIIEKDPSNIQYIDKPSKEIQELAVEKDPETIKYIDSPSKEIQEYVIKILGPRGILSIKNPDPELLEKYKNVKSLSKAGIF